MSQPTSGKVRQRPLSGGKFKHRTANGDVVSYEDVLVAQYLDELRKSPPYTKSGYVCYHLSLNHKNKKICHGYISNKKRFTMYICLLII